MAGRFYSPPIAQAHTIATDRVRAIMRRPNIKLYDRMPVQKIRISRPAPNAGTNADKLFPLGGLGEGDAVPAPQPSSWASALSTITDGVLTLGTQYLGYDKAKDDAKAAERQIEEARRQREYERRLAAEDAKMIEYQQRILSTQVQQSSMPSWILPAAIVGGVGLVALAVVAKKKRK